MFGQIYSWRWIIFCRQQQSTAIVARLFAMMTAGDTPPVMLMVVSQRGCGRLIGNYLRIKGGDPQQQRRQQHPALSPHDTDVGCSNSSRHALPSVAVVLRMRALFREGERRLLFRTGKSSYRGRIPECSHRRRRHTTHLTLKAFWQILAVFRGENPRVKPSASVIEANGTSFGTTTNRMMYSSSRTSATTTTILQLEY